MTTYEPGTVAMIRIEDDAEGRDVLAFRDADPNVIGWSLAERRRGAVWIAEEHVTDVRPLVALDLSGTPLGDTDPAAWVRDFANLAIAADSDWTFRAALLNHIADQIEQQTHPPKPPEPTGLGAVVEDAEGERWVRRDVAPYWYHAHARGFPAQWSKLDVPNEDHILSRGVEVQP